MRIITVTMKIAAPEDVSPGDLLEFASWQIEHWHPNAPLEVQSASATVPQRRGPKPKVRDNQKESILALASQGWKKANIAIALGINRAIVRNTIKEAGL